LRAKFTPDRTAVTEKSLSDAVLPLLPQKSAAGASVNPAGHDAKPPGSQ
jgi:hypothetical protein